MFRLPLILLLLASIGRLHAQDDDEWKTVAGAGYASERVFRGVERSGAAAQGSVSISGDGFRGSVWTSQPFGRSEPGEIDLHAGYAARVTGQLTVEMMAIQYVFSSPAPGATRQSTEAGVQATWTSSGGVSATLAGYHDFRLRADTVQAGATYSLPLKSFGAFLDLDAFAGCARGSDLLPDSVGGPVSDAYSYFGMGATLPYRVGAHTTVVAGVHFTDTNGQSRRWSPIGAAGGARGWVSLAVNVDF